MNVLGLCSGVGGLDLGVRIAVPDARAIAYVEREAYAAATLVARMEDGTLDQAPVWSDLTTFDAEPWRGQVDCVISGDPCQPNSVAGKGGGADDDRWLITRVLDIFETSGASCFFRENVPGNTHGQLAAIVPVLEGLGCDVAAGLFSAAEAGASHRRERLFIMAWRDVGRGERQRLHPRSRPKGSGKADDFGHNGSLGDAPGPRRGGRQSGASRPVWDQGGGPQPSRRSTGLANAECVDAQWLGTDPDAQGWQNARLPAGLCSRTAVANGKGERWGKGWTEFAGRIGQPAPDQSGQPLCAPGPTSLDWPQILDADPLVAPALGIIDLWAIARRRLGLPPMEPDTWDRRGGMARGMDPAALAAAKSMVRRMADGLAPRNDRLRAAGNGVFTLAAAIAWLSLDASLRAGQ